MIAIAKKLPKAYDIINKIIEKIKKNKIIKKIFEILISFLISIGLFMLVFCLDKEAERQGVPYQGSEQVSQPGCTVQDISAPSETAARLLLVERNFSPGQMVHSGVNPGQVDHSGIISEVR